MIRVAEVREPELGPQRHRPVSLERGHAHEEPSRAVALAERPQELASRTDVLQNVGEDRDVERRVGLVGEHVRFDVGHAGVREPRPCGLERPRADIETDDGRARALRDVARDASDPAAHVEDALVRVDAFDEEVVVSRQTVLGMLAAAVVHRAAIDADVGVAVEFEQLPQRLPTVGLGTDRLEPEPEERPPDPEREEDAKRPQRNTPPDTPGDSPHRPGTLRAHADTRRAPR